MKRAPLSPWLLVFLAPACSSGGGGGGGGGDPVADLAALGLEPKDLTDIAGATMVTGLGWLTNDNAVPTRLGDTCPSFVVGADGDSSGHPDDVEIAFDCTDDEGLAVVGSIFLGEYGDPSQFLVDVSQECSTQFDVPSLGTPDWGMSGSFFMTGQELGGLTFNLQGGVRFAEFSAHNLVVFEANVSLAPYSGELGTELLVDAHTCGTLPADDSSDIPVGFIDTFVFSGPPPAIVSLECVLLPDGRVGFDLFGVDDLIGSGVIDLSATDEGEISFD